MSASVDDDFTEYRTVCANRLRRLERYKKAQSFCSLNHDDDAMLAPVSAPPFCRSEDQFFPSDSSPVPTTSDHSTPFEMIKQNMMSLLDTDVSLLQQLLAIGDQISEMKQTSLQRRTRSQSSLEEEYEEDEEDQFDEPPSRFSASMSAVTTLYVEEEEERERPQYFSRKNSVLRIPIPPRASNRWTGGQKIPRRPSDLRGTRHSTVSSLSSFSSSSSTHSSPASTMKGDDKENCDKDYALAYSASRVSACSASSTHTRLSNSSIDSGIRESVDSSASGTPSPRPSSPAQ